MIDTLGFVRRMVESGMAEKTAEQLAHELRETLPESDVATKAFVKTELAELKSELKTDMANLRSELKTDIATLKTDIANARTAVIIWVAVFVVIGQVLPSILQLIRSWGHGP